MMSCPSDRALTRAAVMELEGPAFAAAVLEHVMGAEWKPGPGDPERLVLESEDGQRRYAYRDPDGTTHYEVMPRPDTSAAADYAVLRRVRETWMPDARWSFIHWLMLTWRVRLGDRTQPLALSYEIGDYARAALLTLAIDSHRGEGEGAGDG